jgi:hypothetical protein
MYRENSLSHFEKSENFRRRVRERDRHCVVTGTRNSRFIGLDAAHIFPLAQLELVRIRSLASLA